MLFLLASASLTVACGSDDCNDGTDNDGDTFIDSLDPGCIEGERESDDPKGACNDGIDNDEDGMTDFPADTGCAAAGDLTETSDSTAACNDGDDNDGDGLVDFPDDPGCSLAIQNSEEDNCPDGEDCPACANGVDDDGDGEVDFGSDSGCTSASDNSEVMLQPTACGNQVSVNPITVNTIVTGTTGGDNSPNELTGRCGGTGSEEAYFFEIDSVSAVTITTDFPETTADTVVYLRSDCRAPATELGCNDDFGALVSRLEIPRLEPGGYYLIVDSSGTDPAAYSLEIQLFTPQGEACEPGVSVCTGDLICRLATASSANETCETSVCDDGMDFDGDGLNDYPDDPGCDSPDDADESDDCPSGANCPQCSNGIDDDGDGAIDFGTDPGCQAAGDNLEIDDCVTDVPIGSLSDTGLSGVTPAVEVETGLVGSCAGTTDLDSPENVYGYVNNKELKSLTFTATDTSSNITLHVRENNCSMADSEVGCQRNASGAQVVEILNPTQGDYYVIVDGDFSQGNAFDLSVNGIIEDNRACDVANTQFLCDEAAGFACIAGMCSPAECADGTDNDGDGLIDSADPGCEMLADNTESPDPTVAPQCFDGVDNDSNGSIDYPADPGCTSASDDIELSCSDADPIVQIAAATVTGTTTSASADFSPSCNSSTTAPEIAHLISFPGALATLTVDTFGSSFDTVLEVRAGDCATGMSLGCNDDTGGTQSSVSMTDVDAGIYFISVDGFGSRSGAYTLNVTGVIASGEACDPAQITAGILACSAAETCTAGICQ